MIKDEVVILDSKKNSKTDLTKYNKVQIQKGEEISKSLVVGDTNSILNYGSDVQSKLSSFSSELLGNVRNIDTGEIGGIIQDLLGELNVIKIEEDRTPLMRFLENIPIIKNLISNSKKILDKYDKVSNNIDNIMVKMDKGRSSLLKDIKVLDTMFEKNVNFIDDIESYIIGAKMKMDELESKISLMEQDSNVDPFEIADNKNYLDRLKKKTLDLQLTREITIQSLPQIRVVQANNSVLIDKIQSSMTNTIPIWRNSICLSVVLDKQRRVTEVQKSIVDATNKMLLKNSEILKTNSVEVAKLNERSVVDIETLKKVNQDLISTLDEIMKIKSAGDIERTKTLKELEMMDNEIKTKIVDIKLLSTNKK